MPDSVNNSLYIPPNYSYKGKKEFSTDIDQNAFMRLMIEQLKYQDPLSPMDNQQFVQQTAIMTMVERLTRMQSLMEESNSSLLNIRQYEQLVGKTATYDLTTKDPDTGEVSKEPKTGSIDGVKMKDGKIYFIIGEDVVPREDVTGVDSSSTGDTGDWLDSTLKYTQMIGYTVSYKGQQENPDGTSSGTDKSGVIAAVSMKNGLIEFHLDNGDKITPQDITGLETPRREEPEAS
ncbi:flagellar hook assembly protein FlgD [Brevibacillus massiliensis]|uniref:flagellar hook assembly protein FlgD n=1 Tax=Brevibacillus massiliensis TaxID=1118054 RepID=UPI0003191CEB|nr:flagellar hook capping FlgD N-terminal domain-containing protein [Brevibacillus massiliensis]